MENLNVARQAAEEVPVGAQDVKNIETCIGSKVAQGTVQVDARPFINELIPARIYLFFGKGTAPGAKASFQIIGVPDENAAVVRNTPVVRDTRVALAANWFDEPTEGKYGYKLVLPVGPIQGVNISVAEVNVTTKGLTLKKKKTTCHEEEEGQVREEEGQEDQRLLVHAADLPAVGQAQLPGLLRLRRPAAGHHQDRRAPLSEVQLGN